MKLKKKFKGCLKIPLDTSMSEEQLLASSQWFADWKTKGNIIFSHKRKFTINLYAYNKQGDYEVTKYHHNSKLSYENFKPIIDCVIADFYEQYKGIDDTIDIKSSYITISC